MHCLILWSGGLALILIALMTSGYELVDYCMNAHLWLLSKFFDQMLYHYYFIECITGGLCRYWNLKTIILYFLNVVVHLLWLSDASTKPNCWTTCAAFVQTHNNIICTVCLKVAPILCWSLQLIFILCMLQTVTWAIEVMRYSATWSRSTAWSGNADTVQLVAAERMS